MTIKETDFKEYDKYKDIKGSSAMINKITRGKRNINDIYYWDNSFDEIMIDFNLNKYNSNKMIEITNINSYIENINTVHNMYKKGFIDINEIDNNETFKLLQKHLTASAFRYSLIKRKPFVIMHIKYSKLDDIEIRCILEWIIHTDGYLKATKYKDPIYFTKIGWWLLKDIIEKYTPILKSGMTEYDYESVNSW